MEEGTSSCVSCNRTQASKVSLKKLPKKDSRSSVQERIRLWMCLWLYDERNESTSGLKRLVHPLEATPWRPQTGTDHRGQAPGSASPCSVSLHARFLSFLIFRGRSRFAHDSFGWTNHGLDVSNTTFHKGVGPGSQDPSYVPRPGNCLCGETVHPWNNCSPIFHERLSLGKMKLCVHQSVTDSISILILTWKQRTHSIV